MSLLETTPQTTDAEPQEADQAARTAVSPSETRMMGGRVRRTVRTGTDATYDTDEKSADWSANKVDADALYVPIVRPPRFPRLDQSVALQKWEGRVNAVGEGHFEATLADLTGDGPAEEAAFDLDEVSPQDRALVKPGAVFYWSVGYRDAVKGQRTRESIIRFRRLPRWSLPDRVEADERAARWTESLGWGTSE